MDMQQSRLITNLKTELFTRKGKPDHAARGMDSAPNNADHTRKPLVPGSTSTGWGPAAGNPAIA
jgi:hypothetical protein